LEKELFSRISEPEGTPLETKTKKSKEFYKELLYKTAPYLAMDGSILCNVEIVKEYGADNFYTILPTDIKELKKILIDTIDWRARQIRNESFSSEEKAKKYYESKTKKIKSIKKWETLVKYLLENIEED
jgi:hypothetical protein